MFSKWKHGCTGVYTLFLIYFFIIYIRYFNKGKDLVVVFYCILVVLVIVVVGISLLVAATFPLL